MSAATVFYFAYGSNADPERFTARVGPWRERFAAVLGGHRLRFADSVRSEGGGGAVVDVEPGSVVAGVVFEITTAQLQAMDREEFDPSRDTQGTGRRIQGSVRSADRAVEAELYTVEDDGGWYPPSDIYLAHIIDGLRDAGHDDQALSRVRAAAARAAREADR